MPVLQPEAKSISKEKSEQEKNNKNNITTTKQTNRNHQQEINKGKYTCIYIYRGKYKHIHLYGNKWRISTLLSDSSMSNIQSNVAAYQEDFTI